MLKIDDDTKIVLIVGRFDYNIIESNLSDSISKEQLKNAQNLINDCIVFEMNSQIKQKVISLKQSYKIKLPDAIIAATAIVYNLPFITSDADFKKIKELQLIFLEK